MTRKSLQFALVLLLAIAAAAILGAQSATQPTFKTETNLIEIDAVVTDPAGNIARNLTKDDFAIFDDGKEQPIATFGFVDLPAVSAAAADSPAAAPSDVATNARPFDGRVYILLLDDLHLDADTTPEVINRAELFINRYLGDRDLMAISYSSGRTDAGTGFTSNKSTLLAEVRKFTGRRSLVTTVAGVDAQEEAQSRRESSTHPQTVEIGPPSNLQTVALERATYDSRMLRLIRRLADWSSTSVPSRRKNLILISQGTESLGFGSFTSVFTNRAGSIIESDLRDAVAAMTRANMSVVSVDPRGLDALAGNVADDQREPITIEGHQSLQALADETGGRAILRTNNFDGAFERVVREASSYYVLAYAPPPGRPGVFHSLSVKVKRSGLDVRARAGYGIPPPAATPPSTGNVSAEVAAAQNSPVNASGVRLSVSAVPFKGAGKSASVLVTTEVRGLQLGRPDPTGRLRDEVELSTLATTPFEIKGGQTDRLHLALIPQTAESTGGAIRVLHRLDLAPGTYQLHVAARDGNSGLVGSVTADIVVPDFEDVHTPLAMSGLVLTSARAGEVNTVTNDQLVPTAIETPPDVRRIFSPEDELIVFAELYDRDPMRHQDRIRTVIVGANGHVESETGETVANEDLRGPRGVYEHRIRLQLDGLMPGDYVVRIEADSSLAPDVHTVREVPFSIGKTER